MKKTILIISVMILLFIPIVSAADCSWNPLTWWGCFINLFEKDQIAYDLCRNNTLILYEKEHIYNDSLIKTNCDNKNVSENCERQNINGSWYKTKMISRYSHTNVIPYEKIVCEDTGIVMIGDDVVSLKNHFCKANQCGYKAVCYSYSHARGRFGTGCLLSGEEGVNIKKMEEVEVVYPFEYEIKQNIVFTDILNKRE